MHAWTRSFTAVVRKSAPLPCFGASHLYSATRLVWAPPVFNTCVFDLCRVRVLERLSHPLGRSSLQGETKSKRQLVLCLLVCSGASYTSSWKVPSLRLLGSLSQKEFHFSTTADHYHPHHVTIFNILHEVLAYSV